MRTGVAASGMTMFRGIRTARCQRGCGAVAWDGWDPRKIEQMKKRLAWSPWIVHKWKRKPYAWFVAWQRDVQEEAALFEDVVFGTGCFLAPSAVVVGEPKRGVVFGDRVTVAAETYIRGPVRLHDDVSVNPRCYLHGGSAGITVGAGSSLASGTTLYAFNHGIAPAALIRDQPCTSVGISIGRDVWCGANVSIVDGVSVGDHAVIGMGAVVTKDVPPWAIVAGNPARVIGDRQSRDGPCGASR